MRFEKIWAEQVRATRTIRRRFGAKSALDYLIGVASRKPAARKSLRQLLYLR
jgi:hypothetical protein